MPSVTFFPPPACTTSARSLSPSVPAAAASESVMSGVTVMLDWSHVLSAVNVIVLRVSESLIAITSLPFGPTTAARPNASFMIAAARVAADTGFNAPLFRMYTESSLTDTPLAAVSAAICART